MREKYIACRQGERGGAKREGAEREREKERDGEGIRRGGEEEVIS